MEVIILNDYACVTGGSSAVALTSARRLAERGVPVTLFSCVGPVAPELAGRPNLEVVCLDQPEIGKDPNRLRAFVGGLRNGVAVRRLDALLATKDPARTVVHVHTWTKALSPFAVVRAARRGFRVVITLHDFFITCPTGGFFIHSTGKLCHYRPLSAGCLGCNCDRRNYGHKLWRVARTALQNRVLALPERAAHFVAVSRFSLDVLRPFLPARVPASVIRNPVECVREPAVNVAGNRNFVFVGRLEEEKGARLFAAAVRAAGVPGVFLGDGALAPELRAAYPEIEFRGWLAPAEIRRALRSARAVVFPPLWYETLGLVVIEAASLGIPVIVADSCAATDFIKHGKNGLLFRHGSVLALASQIARLRDQSAEVQRLGAAAYESYWSDPWTADRHADDLLALYRRVLAPHAEPAGRPAEISQPVEAT